MRTSVKTLAAATLAAATFAVVPAASAETVTATVTGGSFTASATATTPLTASATSTEASTSTGDYVITATDLRGTGDGWSVSQKLSTDFTNGEGDIISAANLTVGSFGAAVGTEGSSPAADLALGTTGALGTVATAIAGEGEGSYTIPVNVELAVPAFTQKGDYSATLTISNSTQVPAI